jgi:hypothetical protein
MKLLNQGNAKTIKGEKSGWRTFGIHLAPHTVSGYNVCPWASKGCAAACLNTAGRGAMGNVQKARIEKTRLFMEKKAEFLQLLSDEITAAIKSASKAGLRPAFRLNLTSDIPWEGFGIIQKFPQVQFYDYTKGFNRMNNFLNGKLPANYHLTFSRSESNEFMVQSVLEKGGNVAVVFRNKLPEFYCGKRVVNGDENDLRFLDGKNVVVGLVEKGKAKSDSSGFVVEVA